MKHTHYVRIDQEKEGKFITEKVVIVPITECEISASPVVMSDGDEALTDWFTIHKIVNRLAGQVLTTIDASVADPTQRKAVKDIIRNDFAGAFANFCDLMLPVSAKEYDGPLEDIEEVTLEETIGAPNGWQKSA
jgi:hypothetical protein